ncbi:MAG TPA: DUF6064 family protein [Chryseosolibacter sp.]
MRVPFSIDDFFAVFERYNSDIWPLQLIFYALAIIAIVGLMMKLKNASQMLNQLLSFLWLWMGIVYHINYFASINPAANFFGGMFIMQGLIFAYLSVNKTKLEYRFNLTNIHSIVGIGFIVYGMVLYPLLNYLSGITFPRSPTFGLPCPSTIFTFGLLLIATRKIPWYIFIIPFLWSLIGFSAALTLSIEQDLVLGITGVVSVVLILLRKTQVTSGSPRVSL